MCKQPYSFDLALNDNCPCSLSKFKKNTSSERDTLMVIYDKLRFVTEEWLKDSQNFFILLDWKTLQSLPTVHWQDGNDENICVVILLPVV